MRATIALSFLLTACAYPQTCTLTPISSAIALSALGTASAGGVLPEIPQSFSLAISGNCGTLTATVSSGGPSQGVCGGSGGTFASSAPWLAAGASGSTVTFTALANSLSGARSGTIAIGSAAGASATVTVTEAADSEAIETRQVRALYESILGRDPDAGGFAFWTGAGANGLGYMADDFFTSPEAFNTDFAVIAAYQAGSGAPPTHAQFTAAVSAVRAGAGNIAGLFNSLIAGNPSYTATNLYQNLLGRAPTFLEEFSYDANLAVGFGAIIGFPSATSPVAAANNEFQSTGTFSQGIDHTNSLYIRMLYFTILDRDPDQGGLAYWENVAASGGPGILFQGAAGLATRITILGTGIPGEGFVGSTEFAGSFCPILQ